MSLETFNLISTIGFIIVLVFAISWLIYMLVITTIRTIKYIKSLEQHNEDLSRLVSRFLSEKEKDNE